MSPKSYGRILLTMFTVFVCNSPPGGIVCFAFGLYCKLNLNSLKACYVKNNKILYHVFILLYNTEDLLPNGSKLRK